ncbi:hypothetical protein BJV82DRAFT_175932 [Fennellomyces sp. T-0311]|nr:hypothetical protein BJV82DRAFT_175932 [Fennellomyces sp. T-0311]
MPPALRNPASHCPMSIFFFHTMLLLLPNEILWCILRFVPPRDSLSLLGTCKTLSQIRYDESFWREYARQFGIAYLHPRQTWWQLYASGDLHKTCPHIHDRELIDHSLSQKIMLLWQALLTGRCCDATVSGICLHPACDFMGCGDAFFTPESNPGHLREHHHATGHAYVLKLSPMHFLEVWCYPCNKPVGFWGFPSMEKPIGERYLVRRLVYSLINQLPDDPTLKTRAIECRRDIERRLIYTQQSHEDSYIIDREWFMAWNEYIYAKSDHLPGHLTNSKLFEPKGALRSDIELGKDFELVGGVVRSYIERVYGIDGPVISAYELQWNPEYRAICESILFRRHIMQRGPQGTPNFL